VADYCEQDIKFLCEAVIFFASKAAISVSRTLFHMESVN
jgi:hypothetical protein